MIVSVTVCFEPNLEYVKSQLDALATQVDKCLVIENGPGDAGLAGICERAGAMRIALGSNLGLAVAQNVGLRTVVSMGATSALLMDQDSLPCEGMVAALQQVLDGDPLVAAAGPRVLDMRSGEPNSFLIDAGYWPRMWLPQEGCSEKTANVAHLIASGSLLRVKALLAIGFMEADWFIDSLDIEWGFRARASGWKLVGVGAATLRHQIGDSLFKVQGFRTKKIPLHSPSRNYYILRNLIFLIRRQYVPLKWRLYFGVRILKYLVFYLMLVPNRRLRLEAISTGLWHGVCGHSGARP